MQASCRCVTHSKIVFGRFQLFNKNLFLLLTLFTALTLLYYIFFQFRQAFSSRLYQRQQTIIPILSSHQNIHELIMKSHLVANNRIPDQQKIQGGISISYQNGTTPVSTHVETKPTAVPAGGSKKIAEFVGRRKSNVTILIWTPLTQRKPLWGLTDYRVQICPYQCRYTSDRSYIQNASLILFRLRSLPNTGKRLGEHVYEYDVSALPERKYPQQLWVDVNEESPMYTHTDDDLKAVDDKFDYLSNYHSHSDLPLSYITHVYPRANTTTLHINYSQNKTKTALWFVSHCNATSGRDQYVRELMNHGIHVDIIGACTKNYDGCRHTSDSVECAEKLRSQYKFYLAFENSICSEYITEKYWHTLRSNSYNIPIALGASVEEYERFSPPNSFLHVRNFSGPAHLAQFMKNIDNNDRMFNWYHSWRETHKSVVRPTERLHCWLCRLIYEKPPRKHKHYSTFWTKDMCDTDPEPINITPSHLLQTHRQTDGT